jgi:hypothetical protein
VSEEIKEPLDPMTLTAIAEDHGERLRDLENYTDEIETKLKAVAELHLMLIEGNTENIGMVIRMLKKPRKLSMWLFKLGL